MNTNSASSRSFDPIWENDIYGKGRHLNRYPYDVVVSFLYRNRPLNKPYGDVRVLEVGCGAGNNLWFAAREGFQVTGIDASVHAISYATKRFAQEGLSGEFVVGDFTKLPFEEAQFDLVIDRCALTCTGLTAAHTAASEVMPVLRPGGRFFLNPYITKHSSADQGEEGPDGLTMQIRKGTLAGVGQICFYDSARLNTLFGQDWRFLSKCLVEISEEIGASPEIHAEWRVIIEKL